MAESSSDLPPPGGDPAGLSTTEAVLWLGMVVAMSPIAVDLLRHLADSPWALYALVFPLLFVRCARREGRGKAQPALGAVAIVVALAVELATGFVDALRFARPALALALFGMCRRSGLAPGRSALLLLFAIPAPAFLIDPGSRALGEVALRWIASLYGDSGVQVVLSELQVRGPEAGFVLSTDIGALALAPLIAGLVWYESALSERRLPATLALCAGLAALAIPIQLAAALAATGGALAGLGQSAQPLLVHAPWIVVAAVGIGIAERRLRRREGGFE